MISKSPGIWFIVTGLCALIIGMFMGVMGAFQFVVPGLFDFLPFFKSRPLHVSLVVSWIFLCAVGGIYYYLPHFCHRKLYSKTLVYVHWVIFILTGLAIIYSYAIGKFGGREYWEFPPWLAIPIVISWVLFGINFLATVLQQKGKWPVYYWMWGTGILFFLFTYIESNLWIFDHFTENIVREITVQWKAYGALVGSWNMLVYGTAIFLLEKISGDEKTGNSTMAFCMYFLGLTNLMYGWAHHTYAVPSASWIRHLAYGISMTELLILAKMIWNCRKTMLGALNRKGNIAFQFLMAAEVWIFLNLILAILISVPAINLITHGTHITVAHAMGSTVGINTMILMASVYFILQTKQYVKVPTKSVFRALWLTNIALFAFWVCLICAGYNKGILQNSTQLSFREIMDAISPWLVGFSISGIVLFMGIFLIARRALVLFIEPPQPE